jgi:hypothetical protein
MGAAGSTNTFQWNNGGAFAGGGVGRLRKVDFTNVTNNNGLSDASNVFFGEQCGNALSNTTQSTMFGYNVARLYVDGDSHTFFGSFVVSNVGNTSASGRSSIFGGKAFENIENSSVCVFGYDIGANDEGISPDLTLETCVFGSGSFRWLSGETYNYPIENECVFGHGTETDIADTDGGIRRNVFFGTHNLSEHTIF